MPQVRGVTPALYDNVDKVVTTLLGKAVQELKPIYPQFTRKQTTNRKFERTVMFAPFGDVPAKPEGEEFASDIIMQAWTKDIEPIEWGMMFEVTETALEDDQFDLLRQYARYLVFSMRQVEDKTAALVLDNGFTTQRTADGMPLFSTAHLLKRGGTARNRPSVDADFSLAGLTQAFIDLATETKLESGQIVRPSQGYSLVIHPANQFNALRVLRSTLIPGEANNDVNPVRNLDISMVVNPFLADPSAWYLTPKNSQENGLVYLERRAIHQPAPGVDERTGNRLYKLRARKGWDSIDWRNSYGSPGA